MRGWVTRDAVCYVLQKVWRVLIGSTNENAGLEISCSYEAITHLTDTAVRTLPCPREIGIKRIWSGLGPGDAR